MNQNFALKDCNRKVVIECDRNIVTARLYDGDRKISTGIAKCSPEDVFDFNVGSKLALERAFENIPKPSNVKWVKVDRPIRKGEYVRIIEPNFTFNKVGDILKVSGACADAFTVRAGDHPHPNKSCIQYGANKEWWYLNRYAEVVEPVEETKYTYRPLTRLPKKGDYVRITKFLYDFDSPEYYVKLNDVVCDPLDHFVIGFSVKQKDHPGAMKSEDASYFRDDYEWHYNQHFCKFEFYEKVEEQSDILVYNGQKFRKVNREPKKGDYIRLNKTFFTFDNTTDLMKVHYVDSNCGKVVPHVRHCENPGAMKYEKDFFKSYHPHFIWNYWQFDGDVYELVKD